jgi:hypothetical protein
MSKRRPGRFDRDATDWYPTPLRALRYLAPHLPAAARFYEPCGGDGRMIRSLIRLGFRCTGACDIKPRDSFMVEQGSAFELTGADLNGTDLFISNPPHRRDWMQPMIDHLRVLRPSWMLIDDDWLFQVQARQLEFASDIVPVGRMKIFDDSKDSSTFNFAWVRFQAEPIATQFHRRIKL